MDEPPVTAPPDVILIVDGSFLQRHELAGLWDEVVCADTSFPVARRRGTALFGGSAQTEYAFDHRYRRLPAPPGRGRPAAHATIVVGNDDLDHPVLRRIGVEHTDTDTDTDAGKGHRRGVLTRAVITGPSESRKPGAAQLCSAVGADEIRRRSAE